MYDAEGSYDNDRCPKCGSLKTITYRYEEGFSELECETCGFHSDAPELSDLGRYRGELLEKPLADLPPIPLKKLEA
ncbi:hypothetical protein BH24DEI2_BH24DEI2_06970 [soil metagenome]